ncbi:MAG: hypothetical protein IPM54_06135 [Polyangiaceae bacterium]|nr:hypothetical protein [Polyangiaceae bacterium]
MIAFRALLSVGFVGLALGGGGDVGVRAPASGDVNLPVDHTEPTEAPDGVTFPNFKPSEFPFVTILQHNGTGPGGWQEAKANLEFIRISLPITYIKWYCPITIGMPLRTEALGAIPPSRAATMSATVANSVGAGMDYKLPQGIFCDTFRTGVRAAFPTMYPGLGARVKL